MKLRIKSLFLSLFLFSGMALFAQQNVSDKDLDTFYEIYQVIMMESQQTQMAVLSFIDQEGMEPARFVEIEAIMNGQPSTGAQPTAAELTKYNAILAEIQTLQAKYEAEILKAIQDRSWTELKFQEVGQAIDASEDLQKKLQQKMNAM